MSDMIGEALGLCVRVVGLAVGPDHTAHPSGVALRELAASCLERGIVRHCP
jgi:hypothetical protein